MDVNGPPIHYCDFSLADNVQCCPKYTHILTRKDSSIQLEEVSALQTEIEALLGVAHQRSKLLQNEFHLMNEWQERKERRKYLKPQKRFLPPEGRPMKKQKVGDAGSAVAYDDEMGVYQRPRAEGLHRFWNSVEPYCRDITEDDIVSLNDALSQPDDHDYFNVPPLGKPYTERWAQEDLLEEQRDGSRLTERKRHTSVSDKSATDKMLKQSSVANLPSDGPTDACPLGPLTQRLLAALVDENSSCSMPDRVEEEGPNTPLKIRPEQKMAGKPGSKMVSIPHVASLEARLKEELTSLGVLEVDTTPNKEQVHESDEILTELRQKQEELKSVTAYNQRQKALVLKAAREEMQRQTIRHQIEQLDNDILEVYDKLLTCKARKKALSKKEKEVAWKTLKERQRLISLYNPS